MKESVRIIKNSTGIKVIPCPVCQSDKIYVKAQPLYRVNADSIKYTVWAYCSVCKHRSLGATQIFANDNDICETAYILWNRER